MDQHYAASAFYFKKPGTGLVYQKRFSSLGASISFRSLDLEKDLTMVHEWVNMDYTRTFWQMRGSIGLLRACYQCIQQNPFAHSFIGLMDELPVCQFDVYKVSADELAEHVPFNDTDCGFHLLMSPNNSPAQGLTITLIKAFLDFYFSINAAGKMFGEPDIENLKSIDLLERVGFEKLKTVKLSYKTAQVYSLTKEQFHATHQIP